MTKGAKLSKNDSISPAIMAVIIPPNWKKKYLKPYKYKYKFQLSF